jgi:hypothetical protein
LNSYLNTFFLAGSGDNFLATAFALFGDGYAPDFDAIGSVYLDLAAPVAAAPLLFRLCILRKVCFVETTFEDSSSSLISDRFVRLVRVTFSEGISLFASLPLRLFRLFMKLGYSSLFYPAMNSVMGGLRLPRVGIPLEFLTSCRSELAYFGLAPGVGMSLNNLIVSYAADLTG